MKVLGVDCSTEWACLGLSISGMVAGEFNIRAGREQSSLLALLAGHLMSSCRTALSSLEAIAVTSGPGLFTGIRVGLSYSCGLAEGLKIPVITIDSLSVLGNPFLDGDRVVVPLSRARKGSVYFSVITGTRDLPDIVAPPDVSEIRFLRQRLVGAGPFCFVANDDRLLLVELREGGLDVQVRTYPRGGTVALLGGLPSGKRMSPSEARALYLRSPDIGSAEKK